MLNSSHNPQRRASVERFAHRWALRITGTSYVAMDFPGTEAFLSAMTHTLLAALTHEGAGVNPGSKIGIAFVEAHFTVPDTLEHSLAFLGEELPRLISELVGHGELPEFPVSIVEVLGAIAAGYSRALRDRTLLEQEEILRAGLDARRQAEQARRESEARFRAVFENAAIGIGICDVATGHVFSANQALADMLGSSVKELCQRQVEDFVHPDDSPELWPALYELLRGERDHLRTEKLYLRSDGSSIWTDLVVSLIRDEQRQPQYVIGMAEDITERRDFQQRLRHQATHDPLTELPNRLLFFDRVDRMIASAKPGDRIGLCYVDLDNFKTPNDALGHDTGDRLLVAVAQRLDKTVSGQNRLLARLAGDEFVVLVNDPADVGEVVAIAKTVLASLSEPVLVGELELRVAASVGVLERELIGTSAAELMKDADLTLLRAKANGKGRWALYDAESNRREIVKYQLSTVMPAALEREEFFVDYQPLVNLRDGSWYGAEALVRWQHPELGRLGPDRFVNLAEEIGQIVPLGRWVLRESCRQARVWFDQLGSEAPLVSVNVAVQQLRDQEKHAFVHDVSAALDEAGLPPEKLQLELTESAFIEPLHESLEALRELAKMGVKIAIDDFGTGYSNLTYLRRLPVHTLKLDGTFVQSLRSVERPDPVDGRIVGMLITLAQLLGLSVTAEGIETREQAARLRLLGCDIGQGYLFSRPIPAEQLAGFVAGYPCTTEP